MYYLVLIKFNKHYQLKLKNLNLIQIICFNFLKLFHFLPVDRKKRKKIEFKGKLF